MFIENLNPVSYVFLESCYSAHTVVADCHVLLLCYICIPDCVIESFHSLHTACRNCNLSMQLAL